MPKIAGAVGAFKVLVDGVEIETVSGVTTPDVEIPATEVTGAGIMGTVSIPNFGQVGAMAFAITAPGAGTQRGILMSGGEHSIEVRVAKNVRAVDGSLVPEGTKYFASGYFSKVSGGDIAVGGRRRTSMSTRFTVTGRWWTAGRRCSSTSCGTSTRPAGSTTWSLLTGCCNRRILCQKF